ncbi:hypothetical protein KI688_009685 [Linnemannia hyalina]|uniref:Uncharacterized protein n=1 Tax=Linnemannia hyalina TaxID=64524 RepID=A0A9P7Y1Y7_9FUNG|nr:hypothetical protein KI688_009685 [Linnemannia hyalina]
MSNQTFATGDLRTQLDEIQEVLDRVNPKQENMTTEERQIVQNAQMMKDLAEDVIATKLASVSQQHRKDSIQDHRPNAPASLTLSLPSLSGHPFDPTEAPPPTAATPPPANAFPKGHLRHKSSTASMASSSADRSYTPEGDDRLSRPSSSSSVRRQQKKKSRQSLRQLEPLNDGEQGTSKVEEENNAAFDRICSLLTHLITDASTAVSTAPGGSQQPSNIPIPQFLPLVTSDSESSTHSGASDDDDEDEPDQDTVAVKAADSGNNDTQPQDEFIKRLQGPEGVPPQEELELEIEDPKPSIRYRKSLRSRYDQPTKRLSSLFMELSNTQKTGDNLQDELLSPKISSETKNLDSELAAKEKPVRKPRHSVSSLSISSTRSSRPSSVYVSTNARHADSADVQLNFDGQPLSPKSAPRHRASTSSLRSSRSSSQSDSLPNDLEVQQVLQGVNSELDRTVETIDGLTRDLVAVATHQNWMQMKLQKTLQFQKQQVERIDVALSNSTSHRTLPAAQSRELNQRHHQTTTLSSDPMGQHHPLADLSRSLKQVAVSVGKVLANSTPSTAPRNRLVESLHGPSESEDSTTTVRGGRSTPTPANRKEFTRYFQELEKVAAIGGKMGFDKTDVDGFDTRELLGESLDHRQENHYSSDSHHYDSDQQRESTSSGRGQEQNSAYHSRRGSGASAAGPPELEDFAAQCRLLTRALVLPFVQLTHHAMTSQDSALSLTPRSSRFTDQSSAYDNATLDIIEDLEVSSGINHSKHPSTTSSTGTRRSSLNSASHHASTPREKKPFSPLSSPLLPAAWTSSLSVSGRDLDAIFKGQGELSTDAIVKARSVISTGLYLIHLLYWTALFVIGTIVLDPWLAETAGQQVVRIVEQVRNAVAKDGIIGQGIHRAIDQGHQQLRHRHSFEQQQRDAASGAITDSDLIDDHLSLDQDLRRSTFSLRQQSSNHWNAVDDDNVAAAPDSTRLQDLEDRAIEVAVGFESLKQRLGSSPGSTSSTRSSFRPISGLWSRPNSFQSTASALTEATMGGRTLSPDSPLGRSNSQNKERPLSQVSAASSSTTEGSVLRTISWAGPRRRRATRDGNSGTQARVRRYSNNSRGVNVPLKAGAAGGEFAVPTVTLRQGLNVRRDRPQTHWGTFESSSSVFSSDNTSFGLGHSRGPFREASCSISSTASSSTTLSEFILPPYNMTAGGTDVGKVNLAAKAYNWVQTGAATAVEGVEGAVHSQSRRRSM